MPRPMRERAGDQAGQASLEWVLLLTGFALPMMLVFRLLLSALASHFGMVSFFQTMPLP